MLTTWGRKALSANIKDNSIYVPSLNTTSIAMIECKNISGNTMYIGPVAQTGSGSAFLDNAFTGTGAGSSYGIAVGTDGHSESDSDYILGNQITGLEGNVVNSTYYDTTNDKYVARSTITITNDTGNDVTIREIGKFAVFYKATQKGVAPTSSNANKISVMIDRTVLNTPVVIPNGEAGVILYDFDFE